MGIIHYSKIKTYNNGALDDNIYSSVQNSFNDSSKFNPFDVSPIHYDEDEFEDQTTQPIM